MKKIFKISSLSILFVLFFTNYNQAQIKKGICVSDKVQKEIERRNPELKEKREKAEQELRNKMNSTSFLMRMGLSEQNEKYNGKIYEIPVVVHVIENRSGNGNTGTESGEQLTDSEIKTWIDKANEMFAGTHRNFFPQGDGVDESAVIPFKLVLAKVSATCSATNGIVRYDAANMPNGKGETYMEHGMKYPSSTENGIEEGDVLELAPHWDENTYYNIYIVSGIDDDFSISGVLGYATYCTSPDNQYHTVMKASVVTLENDETLAHEFGHALGLKHTFEGVDHDSDECASEPNDEVDDTEVSKSMYGVSPLPTNQDTNVCTGKPYQGVQYNVMNYTEEAKKFTPGQRARAVAMFLEYKKSLTESKGAQTPTEPIEITDASCIVTGVKNKNADNDVGAVEVVFGTINNSSEGYSDWSKKAYVDYATHYCYNSKVVTNIYKTTYNTLKIRSLAYEKQDIKIWIDYNNNGTFEKNENVVYQKDTRNVIPPDIYTFKIKPPANAVTGKYLRMRVAGDSNNPDLQACGEYNSGQAQDYLVKILKPKTLTVSLNKISKVYDGSKKAKISTKSFILEGKQDSDEVYLDLKNTTAVYDNENAGTNKTVYVKGLALKGADSLDYELAKTSITAKVGTIKKRLLKVSLTGSVNKVYNGTTNAKVSKNNFLVKGIIKKDAVALNLAKATANYDNKNVGTGKTLTVKGISLSGTDKSNYWLKYNKISGKIGTISPKEITVTAEDKKKEKGEAEPKLSYTVSPELVNGDTFTGKLEREKGENAGEYKITQGDLSAGKNYKINFVGAKFTITTSTGIGDIASSTFKLYPIPVKEGFTVETSERGILEIYSINGAKIRTIKITADKQFVATIGLKNGSYIAKMNGNVVQFVKE